MTSDDGIFLGFDPGGDRRSFTGLRAAINALIAPLEVDHVDFEAVGVD